jgi:acetoin utilization deacetylase AcuC-like enzyme
MGWDGAMRTGFYHDERTLWHFGAIHAGNVPAGGWVQPSSSGYLAEAPDPKRRIVALMEVSGLMAQVQRMPTRMADRAALLAVHDAGYIERFAALSAAGGGSVGHDASFGPGGFDIAALSAGMACDALDAVMTGTLDNAYVLARPPGHHCLRDAGYGFCLLANVAIAVEQAIARHGLSRVAVIDWDVHHGNGTQALFYDRPDVLTLSLHQENCYPVGEGGADETGQGAGAGCNINVPLQAGGGDQSYRDAFDLIVAPALRRYRPQAIVIASGFDANALDPLARMQAHSETFRWMMQQAVALAGELCGGRLVAVHEGGYSEVYVPFCAQAAIEALAGVAPIVADPLLDFIRRQQPGAAFAAFQRDLLVEQAAVLGLGA